MPATINGIGTTYYGKKHVQLRPAVCPHCSKGADLASYDTRLWFVVLYIPVIPLGRKRILDYCPHCTQHSAMPLKKWEEYKQESITPLLAEFQSQPNDPEVAKKLHAQLCVVGQQAEAGRMGKLIAERFPRNAGLLAYLGHATSYWGRPEEASSYFEKAFAADPNLPEARTGLASDLIRQGRLEEGHNLLRFLEQEPEPELGPWLELAEGYQKAGRHRQALDIFSLITKKNPELAKDKAYRRMVRNSEKGRTPGKTLIPPALGAKLKWAAAITLLAVIIFGSNYYITQNRTLYVLNGYEGAMQVEIDGQTLRVPKGGVREVALSEGKYTAKIASPVTTNVNFEISSGFFDRWLDSPAFVLNPGAQAVFFHETTIYTPGPANSEYTGAFHLYFGRQFQEVPDVDYEFEPFPSEIKMSSSARQVQKSRIDILQTSVEDIYYDYAEEDPARALDLAEWRLETRPEQPLLLAPYIEGAAAQGQEERAEGLVQKMVKHRPALVEWHRHYQGRAEDQASSEKLIQEYDQWLKEDPRSAALHYLRGRLTTNRREAAPYYKKSLDLDPQFPHSYYALAFGHSGAGEWPEARSLLARALEYAPGNAEFEKSLFLARFACGELDALEQELKNGSAHEPLHVDSAQRLHWVLLAAHKPEEARRHFEKYKQELSQALGGEFFPPQLEYMFHYAAADFKALERLCLETNGLSEIAWQPLLESGQPRKALEVIGSSHETWEEPFVLLSLAAGLRHHGMNEEAAPFLARGISALEKGRPEYGQLASLLTEGSRASVQDAADLSLHPHLKAIGLINLAQNDPVEAPAMLTLARKLNVTRSFPYHLIQQITSAGQK